MRATRHRAVLATTLAIAALSAASPTLAHPLGNFTISHYSGVRVTPTTVEIDHVLDMAEIPTFSERAAMDVDADGAVTDGEARAYAARACAQQASALDLRVGGERSALRTFDARVSFPPGQGALTLRLECGLRADLGTPLAEGTTAFRFEDATYAARRGWREVVVIGDGATVRESSAPTLSASARLARYPADLLAQPLTASAATWSAIGGGALATRSGPSGPGTATDATPRESVVRPSGEIAPDLARLFDTRELTLALAALLMLVATGLGALHALSPGHGKTVMAAYLVGSRGTVRQAIGLGLAVAVSHTVGVLLLGVLSLAASSAVPIERLYPILGTVSGVLVVALGTWLLIGRVQVIRAARAHDHEHRLAHATGIDHHHHDDHEHHEHDLGDARADGPHSHGLVAHRHAPVAGSAPGWRGLVALGLAGGMVPSVSALILMLGSVSLGRPAFGIVLTTCFGLGMAAVLVGIGAVLVFARHRVERLASRGLPRRLGGLMPTATAVIVLVVGVTLTGQALATAW